MICIFLLATSCQLVKTPEITNNFGERHREGVNEAKYYLNRSIVPDYIQSDIWNVSLKNASYRLLIEFWSDPELEIVNEKYSPNTDLRCEYTSEEASAKWAHCERSWNVGKYRLSEVVDASRTYSGVSWNSAHVLVIQGTGFKPVVRTDANITQVSENCSLVFLGYYKSISYGEVSDELARNYTIQKYATGYCG